jgi:primosomal protein N' (replication factor Y)
MKNIIQVLLPSLQKKSIFDYSSNEDLELGTIVKVPLRNEELEGIVWSKTKSDDQVPYSKIKEVLRSTNIVLSPHLIPFIKFISQYNLIPLGAVLKLFFPFPNLNFLNKLLKPEEDGCKLEHRLPMLNDEQEVALGKIREALYEVKIKPILLEGVTGSGKTEVYLHAIWDALKHSGAQALVLLPEIMLTNNLVQKFKETLGVKAGIWHSGISQKEKKQTWKKLMDGSCNLVIGARSALFLPFKNLKLIVIDEEHDQSYKQEDNLIYNARDMGVALGSIAQIPVILSSATPSLETFYNVKMGKYLSSELLSRYHQVSLPDISIINMKQANLTRSRYLSDGLIDKATKSLETGAQVMLFLNRKGYAPITLCIVCDHKLNCPNCSSFLVMYKDSHKLLCHHCGHSIPYPTSCPACKSTDTLINCGPGVDRLFEEAKSLWPDKNICAVTRDIIQRDKTSGDILNDMDSGKIDILIGTQILSKGHHFPNLNLVGIIDADIGLSGADLKASERTHQLLTQVSGRAGRETKGEVLIQTYNPDNPLLGALATHNKKMFYSEEFLARQMMNMPPFSKLVALIFSGISQEKLKETVKDFASQIPYIKEIEVLGPAPAPIAKIRKHYRYRFLIKSHPKVNMQKYIQRCIKNFKLPKSIRLKIDIDPYNFL